MALYTVRVIKDGRTLARRQISGGLGRTDALVLKAQAGVLYVLGDELTQTAPSKMAAKRVGQNLHLALESGHPDVPDVVIEDYFDFPPAQVAGVNSTGALAAYDFGRVGESGASVVHAALPEPAASFAGMSMGSIGWGLAALGGALALSGGGSGAGAAAPVDAATAALATVADYATSNTKPAPAVTDYTAAGVTGVTSSNLSSINSAVDALTADKVNTKEALQKVVDAYVKILTEANGSATTDATPAVDPTSDDFAAIGADIGVAKTSVSALKLLNDVIGPVSTTSGLSTTDVNTIAKINALGVVVGKIMAVAAGTTPVAALTLDDFYLLGFSRPGTAGAVDVNATNLAAVVSAIGSAGGENFVDQFSELSTVVTAAAVIANYASDKTLTAPSLANYTALLGDSTTSKVTSDNFQMINTAVDALSPAQVSSKAALQAVVNTYLKIYAEANGSASDATTDNPTAPDFAAIGAAIGLGATGTAAGTDLASSALKLLNNAIGGLTGAAIDTVGEINALGVIVDKVMHLAEKATGATVPVSGTSEYLTMDDLAALGVINTGGADTAAERNGILQDIINASDSGLDVQTVSALQSFVDARIAVDALAKIAAYAQDGTPTLNQPALTDYVWAGIKNVNDLNAINSAVDALTSGAVDTKAKLQAVVDSYNKIEAEANGSTADQTPANPTAQDYANIGASIGSAATGTATGTDAASNALSLLNDAIANFTTTAVDTVFEINTLAGAVDRVFGLAALATGSALPNGTNVGTLFADLSKLGVNTALVNTTNEYNNITQKIIDSSDIGAGVRTIFDLQQIVNSNAT